MAVCRIFTGFIVLYLSLSSTWTFAQSSRERIRANQKAYSNAEDTYRTTLDKCTDEISELDENPRYRQLSQSSPESPVLASMYEARQNKMNECQSQAQRARQDVLSQHRETQRLFDQDERRSERIADRCQRAREDLSKDQAKLPSDCLQNPACVTARDKCNNFLNALSQAPATHHESPGFLQGLSNECPSLAKNHYETTDDKYEDQLDEKNDLMKDVYDLRKDLTDRSNEEREDLRDVDEKIQEASNQMQKSATEFHELVSNPPQSVQNQISQFRKQILDASIAIRTLSRNIETLQTEAVDEKRRNYQRAVRGILSQCDIKAQEAAEELNKLLDENVKNGAWVRTVNDLTKSRAEKLRERAARSYALCRNSRTTMTQLQEAREQYEAEQRSLIRQEQELIDQIQGHRDNLALLEIQMQQAIEQTDRAFEAAFQRHSQGIGEIHQRLQLHNQEKQEIHQASRQEQQQLMQQLAQKDRELQFTEAEMRSLAIQREAVKGSRIFGDDDRDTDDQITWNQYNTSLENARATCCGQEFQSVRAIAQVLKSNNFCVGIQTPRPSGRSSGQED